MTVLPCVTYMVTVLFCSAGEIVPDIVMDRVVPVRFESVGEGVMEMLD